MSKSIFSNLSVFALALAVLGSSACSFVARGPDQYRDDTQVVLNTKDRAMQACYDREVASNAALEGKLTVTFTVEKKTGAFTSLQVDKARTTVPDSMSQCVVDALSGLTLAPEDKRDGQATFVWEFKQARGNG